MTAPGRRRDRPSKVIAIAILVAIIVPVLYLVINAAVRGPDAINFDTNPTSTVPAPRAPQGAPQDPPTDPGGGGEPDRFRPPSGP